MGQQLKARVKRRRRKNYLVRKKELAKSGFARKSTRLKTPKSSAADKPVEAKAPAKKAAKKAPAKKTPKAAAPEVVALEAGTELPAAEESTVESAEPTTTETPEVAVAADVEENA